MGKKARRKNRNNRQRKSVKPDDYFRFGPLEMARFGEKIVTRNNMSNEQFKAMQERLAGEFPEICQEIDKIIAKIAELVKILPPDRLLYRAAWEKARHHINIKSEIEIDHEAAMSLRMIDYVQSIIFSFAELTSRGRCYRRKMAGIKGVGYRTVQSIKLAIHDMSNSCQS